MHIETKSGDVYLDGRRMPHLTEHSGICEVSTPLCTIIYSKEWKPISASYDRRGENHYTLFSRIIVLEDWPLHSYDTTITLLHHIEVSSNFEYNKVYYKGYQRGDTFYVKYVYKMHDRYTIHRYISSVSNSMSV